MIGLIICFIMVVLIYKILLKFINTSCIDKHEFIKYDRIVAQRIPNLMKEKITNDKIINVRININIPCGIYKCDSYYGDAIIIVSREHNNKAIINFINFFQNLDEFDRFELKNITRMTNTSNDYINTYNRGCCK